MKINFRYFYLSFLLLLAPTMQAVAVTKESVINTSGPCYVSASLFKIETAINSQREILYQIQQQLLDAQQNIDKLHGEIQKNQHQLGQINQGQKDLCMHLNSSIAAINLTKLNNIIGSNNSILAKLSNEKADYDAALTLAIRSKSKQQIVKAISSFQCFIKTYPRSNYQSNANYWLGQLNYNRGNKDDAAFYFATVVKKYPNSPKVPESLYKIGLLMQERGKNDKARFIYQQVIKAYPGSFSAQMAEKKLISI